MGRAGDAGGWWDAGETWWDAREALLGRCWDVVGTLLGRCQDVVGTLVGRSGGRWGDAGCSHAEICSQRFPSQFS